MRRGGRIVRGGDGRLKWSNLGLQGDRSIPYRTIPTSDPSSLPRRSLLAGAAALAGLAVVLPSPARAVRDALHPRRRQRRSRIGRVCALDAPRAAAARGGWRARPARSRVAWEVSADEHDAPGRAARRRAGRRPLRPLGARRGLPVCSRTARTGIASPPSVRRALIGRARTAPAPGDVLGAAALRRRLLLQL